MVFSRGSCAKHIEFIEKHLGGSKKFEMKKGDLVEHAAVTVNGGPLFLCDRIDHAYGAPSADDTSHSQATQVYLGYASEEEGKKSWEKVAPHARVIAPLEAKYWGSYYGVLEDPFGTVWAICFPDSKAKAPHGSQSHDDKEAEAKKHKGSQ
jgi:uncharacterized glyoxalase superfamily protein PhnB